MHPSIQCPQAYPVIFHSITFFSIRQTQSSKFSFCRKWKDFPLLPSAHQLARWSMPTVVMSLQWTSFQFSIHANIKGVVCALLAIDIMLIILYSYKPTSLRPNLTVDLDIGLETYVSPVNCPNLIIVPGEERRKNNNIYVKKCPTSAVKRLSAFNHSWTRQCWQRMCSHCPAS